MKTQPVLYNNNKSGSMTGAIFNKWRLKLIESFHLKKEKVHVVVDNCSYHDLANEHLQSIKLDTLPLNCTSKLQCCDLGIIKNLKVISAKLD